MTARSKPWWRSRTLWFNAIAFALIAAEANVRTLQSVISDGELFAIVAFALPVINAALRVITTAPVTATKENQP